MSSTTFQDTVTHVPSAWANDVDALVYDIFAAAQTLADVRDRLGMKSMAFQDAANVSINGGSINGASAGLTTPLTEVVAQKAQVLDSPINGQDVVNLDAMASYVANRLSVATTSFTKGFGSLAAQNKNNVSITGGTLDNVDIGTQGRATGAFTALKASNVPTDGDDVVTLGWLTAHYDVKLDGFKSMALQDRDAVQIIGGTIDGTNIGLTAPGSARFLRATLITQPTNNEDVANKRYVDSSIAAFSSSLGSMAFQAATAVAITGGAIDGTPIGTSLAAAGRFNGVTVVANQALLKLKTNSTASDNQSGIQWQDVNTVASFLYRGAASSLNPSTLELSASVPISMHTQGAAVDFTNVNLSLSGARISLGETTANQVMIGAGSTVAGMKLTVNGKAHFEYAQTKRSLIIEGQSKHLDSTYAESAAGSCPLNTNTNAAYEITVIDDVAITLLPSDNNWPANGWREIELLIRHGVGGQLVAFPASVKWGGNVPPDYSYTVSGDFDIVRLKSKNGVEWFGVSDYANTRYQRLPVVVFLATTSGGQTRLTWDVRDAIAVNITNIGPVSASGSVVFATPGGSVQYVLTAAGSDGRSSTAATITVAPTV